MLQQISTKGEGIRTHSEFVAHYKEVRKRLMGTAPPPAKKIVKIEIGSVSPSEKIKIIRITGPKTKANLIIHHIAASHMMTREEVFSESRKNKIVRVRMEIWTELHKLGLSLPLIGRICRPNKPYDHTTILNGIRKFPRYAQQIPQSEPDDATKRDSFHMADEAAF